MTSFRSRSRTRHRLRRGRPYRPGTDGGFVLLEAIVSIALITVIMTALTALFVTSMKVTNHQRLSQNAIRIATDVVDQARGLGPEPADTTGNLPSVDTALLPATQSISGTTYAIAYDQSWCRLANATTGGNPTCALADPAAGTLGLYLRLGVTLSWSGSGCPTSGCTYATSVIMNTDSDPYFPDPTTAMETTTSPVATTTTPVATTTTPVATTTTPVATTTTPVATTTTPTTPAVTPLSIFVQNQSIPKSNGNCKGDSISSFSVLVAPNYVTGGSAAANLSYSISSSANIVTMSGPIVTIVAPCKVDTYAATVTVTDTSATNPSPPAAATFSIQVTNN